MKTALFFAVVLGLFAAGARPAHAAAPTTAPISRAEVIFDHPEKFTDIKDGYMPTDSGSQAILAALRDYLVLQARYFVPEGCKLTMTFTDIDLAGDFEPWRGAQFEDIRIVKDIYPPRFKFSYALTDSSGRVIRQSREDIVDLSFQMRVTLDRQDPLRYEKEILKDWMRSRLRGAPRVAIAR